MNIKGMYNKKNIFYNILLAIWAIGILFICNEQTAIAGITLPDINTNISCCTDITPPPEVGKIIINEFNYDDINKPEKPSKEFGTKNTQNIKPDNAFNKKQTKSEPKSNFNSESGTKSKIKVIGQNKQENAQTLLKTTKNDSYEPNLFTLTSSLVIVIILIFISVWLYLKISSLIPSKILSSNKDKLDNKLNIIATTSLGQGKNVHLIEVNGTQIVIGSTPDNLSLLGIVGSDTVKEPKKNDFDRNIIEEFNKIIDEEEKTEKEQNVKLNDDALSDLDGYTNLYKKYLNT